MIETKGCEGMIKLYMKFEIVHPLLSGAAFGKTNANLSKRIG